MGFLGRLPIAVLLFVAPCLAQDSLRAVREANDHAAEALLACVAAGGTCTAERAEYQRVSEEFQQQIAELLRTFNAKMEAAAAEAAQITEAIHRHAVCRASRHWWQFWKHRCTYGL